MKKVFIVFALVFFGCRDIPPPQKTEDVSGFDKVKSLEFRNVSKSIYASCIDYVVIDDYGDNLSDIDNVVDIQTSSLRRLISMERNRTRYVTNTFVYLSDSLYYDSKSNWAIHIAKDVNSSYKIIDRTDAVIDSDEKALSVVEEMFKSSSTDLCSWYHDMWNIENMYFDDIEERGVPFSSDNLWILKKKVYQEYSINSNLHNSIMDFGDLLCD